MRHFLEALMSGDLSLTFELKICTPITGYSTLKAFTPILFYTFVVFELGARVGQT